MAEFDLIARIKVRVAPRDDVVLGIGDDAALLRVPPGKLLVVATDTLNTGVHFPDDTAPADIGWKALAVNLSDLAAMGAEPAWCTLSLSLPQDDPAWLDRFLDGFLALAGLHDVALVGGDTTRGPLSVCVMAHGFVSDTAVLRRDAARAGDDIWVTGTLGDAAGALTLLLSSRAESEGFVVAHEVERTADSSAAGLGMTGSLRVLRARLDRPTPRVATGLALAGIAHACIDISDGLLADLGHVCVASGVGAEVEIDVLPASAALRAAFADKTLRRVLQATGGDDYELCFTASPEQRAAIERIADGAGTALTRIGRIVAGAGVQALTGAGVAWASPRTGYAHFAD